MMVADTTADVLIVGGGVIGCALAYDLAAAGIGVKLLERDTVGSGTSYGAGGMLAPQIEFSEGGLGLEWGLRSLALYREWDHAIGDRIGLGLDLDLSGVLRVTEGGPAELGALAARQIQMGHMARLLDGPGIRDWAPGINSEAQFGLWVPGGQVDAWRATRVLAQAAASQGAMIHTGVTVTGLEDGAVLSSMGRLEAQYIIVAAGAWIPHLLDLPLRPVKGQRLLVELPQLLARAPVFGDGVYVVPKAGGRYFLGATEEPDGGYDRRATLAGMTAVGAAAARLFPKLAQAQVVEQWAGLRPVFPDGLPMIAPVPQYDRVLVVGGHYRHGFLLAPATARAVRDWMIQRTPLPSDFSYNRLVQTKKAVKAALKEHTPDHAVNVTTAPIGNMLRVEVTIAADPAVVYRVFCDPTHYPRLMPDIQQVEVVEAESTYRIIQWTVHYFGQRIVWTERQTWNGRESLEGDLVASSFFDHYHYCGRVTRDPVGSLVTIEVEMTSRRRGLVLTAAQKILGQNLQAFLHALGQELEAAVSES